MIMDAGHDKSTIEAKKEFLLPVGEGQDEGQSEEDYNQAASIFFPSPQPSPKGRGS
jgi:hypothetical protein